jgi:hypothetical protein|tara:strand:+ start:13250 stop:13465 length:216 start_codon:yes stop_codon:yes gene_type:complete
MSWTLRDKLADFLFGREIDEAFYHGHKEGGRNTIDVVVFALETHKLKMSKARKEGFDLAVEMMRQIQDETR